MINEAIFPRREGFSLLKKMSEYRFPLNFQHCPSQAFSVQKFDFERVNLIPNEANLLFKKEMINSYFSEKGRIFLTNKNVRKPFPAKN